MTPSGEKEYCKTHLESVNERRLSRTLLYKSIFVSLWAVKTLNLQFLAQCFHNLLIRKKVLLYLSSSAVQMFTASTF